MRRSYLLAAILCLTLLLAGCTGGTPGSEGDATTATVATTAEAVGDATDGGDGSATDTTVTVRASARPTTEATPVKATPAIEATAATAKPTTGTTTTTADGTSSETTTAGDVAGAHSTGEHFHEGEYYRLNTTIGAVVEFEVVSIEGKEVTVEITSTTPDGNESTTTIQAESGSVLQAVFDSKKDFGFLLLARAPTAVVEGRSLTVGEEFTVESTDVTVGGQTPEPGTFSVAVTGTDSVSGVECTTVDIDLDGQDRQTACVNPSLLFAPRTTLYDDEGEPTGTIFIEEYRSEGGNDTNERATRRQ